MIFATLKRGRFTGQTSQTILRLYPSSVRPVTDLSPLAGMDLLLPLGRSFLILRLHSTLVGSTASCSRVAHLPLRDCRQWLRSPSVFSWCGRRFRDLRVTTIHQAPLNASRHPGGELTTPGSLPKYTSSSLVVFFGPIGVLISVVSFERNLLQVVDPSFTGARPCGVSNPSAHVAGEAFCHACGLSSTHAFCPYLSPSGRQWPFLFL